MQRRGHQATILTSSQHRSRVEPSGIRFLQVAPDFDFSDKTFQRRATDEMTGGRYMLRDVMLPPIRTNYDNLLQAASEADLLVTQMLAFAGPLVAEKTGIPWVSTVLAPLSFFSSRDSPILAARLRTVRETAPWLNAFINRVARSTTQSWNEPVYRLRRELGLPECREPIYEGQHSPTRVLAMFFQCYRRRRPTGLRRPGSVVFHSGMRLRKVRLCLQSSINFWQLAPRRWCSRWDLRRS